MDLLKKVVTLAPLAGYRTYLAAYGLMAFAVIGYFTHNLDAQTAISKFLEGAAMAGLRRAL